MAAQPAPNWYDDGSGHERWWDGRGWTQYTRPRSIAAAGEAATSMVEQPVPTAGATAASGDATPGDHKSSLTDGADDQAERPRVRIKESSKRFLVPLIVGLVAFLIGMGAGHGDAAPASVDPTTTPAFSRLETALSAMTTERDDLKQQVDAASAEKTDLETRTAELDSRESDLDAQQKKLDSRSKKLDKREAELASSSDSSSSSSSDSAETQAKSVYYENCTAARAAGAAPVRAGDPGYSRKLDRDGDGVGCE
ncbi:hypothetical protein GCM10009869_26090 [Amnibacterium kyonggiense]